MALRKFGFDLGTNQRRNLESRHLHKYECGELACEVEDCPKCPASHCPGRKFTPYSFTVIREPFSRLLSEFLMLTKIREIGTKTGRQKNMNKCSCKYFTEWLKLIIRNLRLDAQDFHCHFLPQVLYAKNAEWVLHTDNLDQELPSLLEKQFGLKNFTLTERSRNLSPETGKSICKETIRSCLQKNEYLMRWFNDLYAQEQRSPLSHETSFNILRS